MRIRYAYVNNIILNMYGMLHKLEFPMDMVSAMNVIPNCRHMTYDEFATVNGCSIRDVIQMCESKSGCTHYDVKNDRYLILYNNSTQDNNNIGRQRWTIGHEIGHVVCNHLSSSAYQKLAENSFSPTVDRGFESEADYFSAMFIAPFPLFKELDITSPIRVQDVFGLSDEASLYRYKQYLNWSKSRIKTAWENDMLRTYKNRQTLL